MCYIQVFYLAFLVMYAIILLLSFHHHPFRQQNHRLYVLEILIFCYVCGLVTEEFVQVSSFNKYDAMRHDKS